VHGVGGFTGTLPAGVFAVGALSVTRKCRTEFGGLFEGNPQQVVMQVYGIAVTLLWSDVMTFITLKVMRWWRCGCGHESRRDLARPSLAISTDYFLSSPSGHWRDFKRQPPAAFRSVGGPPGSRW